MPPRFHSKRKSVNTQSSISRDQAYTGFAPILLTRYKKILMPAYFLKMHLESLAHFNLSTHIASPQWIFNPNDFTIEAMSSSLFVTSQPVAPISIQSLVNQSTPTQNPLINQSTDAQLVRCQLVRPLIPPPKC